jgi:hypothetical protein
MLDHVGNPCRSMGQQLSRRQVCDILWREIDGFSNGKVVEPWTQKDDLGLMQQIGVPIYSGIRSS